MNLKLNLKSTQRTFAMLSLPAAIAVCGIAHAQGIAFITDVKGEATLDANKAGLMAELKKGNRLGCIKACEVGVMYLQSGKEFVLKGPGNFVVGEAEVAAKVGPPPKMRETDWKVSGKTVNAFAQATSSASIRMRSIGVASALKTDALPPAERLIYPTKTTVVSLQPAFRWASLREKGPFDFELKSVSSSARPIYKSTASATNIKLPGNLKLKPDVEYAWTVKSAGKEVGTSTFKTLPAHSLELTQKRKPLDKAAFSDWLLYALTLQELGASQDASEVFEKLVKDRPDLPELAELGK